LSYLDIVLCSMNQPLKRKSWKKPKIQAPKTLFTLRTETKSLTCQPIRTHKFASLSKTCANISLYVCRHYYVEIRLQTLHQSFCDQFWPRRAIKIGHYVHFVCWTYLPTYVKHFRCHSFCFEQSVFFFTFAPKEIIFLLQNQHIINK
jgi:hypothetical protein